jgi:Kdo2-lipid IVA lauroyltransferase/acyltransferase
MTSPPLSFGRKLRYGAEAALFFAFMALFRLIGLDVASALGSWIGRKVFSRLPPAKIARANLVAAYPEKSAAEIAAILTGMWDNLGRVVAEYPHLEKFDVAGPDPRIRVTENGDMAAAFARGKGVLFLSGHLANWEMMPIAGQEWGFAGATVVRHPNNPYVARWIARQRSRRGPREQIGKHSGARRIFAQLRAGNAIYMLVDQKNDEGMAVPFFGRDAMTTPVPAALALKLGAQILFASNRRAGGSRFDIVIHPLLDFEPSGDEARDISELTRAITARIEELVRSDPSQWLWIHNRWGGPRGVDSGNATS